MSWFLLAINVFLLLLLAASALFFIFLLFATVWGHIRGAPFVRSPREKIEIMLELAALRGNEIVIDLGSGNGDLVLAAAQKGCRAIGLEINPFLVWNSRRRVKKLGLKNKVKIIRKNLFKYSLSEADVVFAYLFPKTMEKLKEKFSNDLKPETKIISLAFPIPGWNPLKEKDGVFLYLPPTKKTLVGKNPELS